MFGAKRQPLERVPEAIPRNISRNSSSDSAFNRLNSSSSASGEVFGMRKTLKSSNSSSGNQHSSFKQGTSNKPVTPKLESQMNRRSLSGGSSLRYGSRRSITISKQRLEGKTKEAYSKKSPAYERASLKGQPGNTSLRADFHKEFIVSIIEHTTHEVGLAVYNINSGEIFLSQMIERMTYVQTLSTLSRFMPREIIICSNHETTPLVRKLENSFPSATFKPVKRSFFDDTRGYRIYSERGNKNKGDLNPDNRVMKMLACSALTALLMVIESDLKLNVKYEALHIEWHYPSNVLIIDEQTVSDLELFVNSETNKTANSFLENFRCITCGGTRMLRANLLQPLCDKDAIEDRLDTVFFLLKNPSLTDLLKADIARFKMLEPIAVKFIQQPKPDSRSLKSYIYYILLMSHFISSLDHLRSRLEAWMTEAQPTQHHGRTLHRLMECISDPRIDQIRQVIVENLDTEVLASFENTSRSTKDNYLFVVRESKIADEQCHISRVTYSQTVEDLSKVWEEYKSKTLMSLKLCSTERRGYFLSYTSNQPEEDLRKISELLHEDIVHISFRERRMVTFETTRIVSMNNKLRIHEDRILHQSQSVLLETVHAIQERLELLFDISYWMSLTDMLLSFSNFVSFYTTVRFCRPIFTKVDMLSYRGLSTIWTHQRFFRPSEKSSFLSTQLRPITVYYKNDQSAEFYNRMISTGYLVILSQIGCPVPAEAYSACLFNMLLSKLKNNVSIENGLSHFQYEVVVLNGLLEANEPNMRALVLIDEILKGTNYEEELSISLGFLRYLQGMRGFVIAMISDEELIRHIGTSFDYVRIINAIGERQSVTSACDKLGICEQFADIVRTYEERHNEAQESGILPKFDPQEKFIDDVEMELLKYYEANNSDVDFSERQRHLEFIAEKLKTTLSAQMTSERIINEIDSSSPDFMEESQ